MFGLAVDVLSAKALVWIASVGRDAELTRDAHLYFADRYSRLARIHRARGRTARAASLTNAAAISMLAVSLLIGMLGWGLAGWPMTLLGLLWPLFLLFHVGGGRRVAQPVQ